MERRGANTWLIAALAIAVGFLAALLLLRGNDSGDNANAIVSSTSSTTAQTSGTATTSTGAGTTATRTSTAQGTAPQNAEATLGNCVNLWNQGNNRGNQTFLVNVMS